jgi:hypothetical protein
MSTTTWAWVAVFLALYFMGFFTGMVLGRQRTRHRMMRELAADPATLRKMASQIENARFEAASAQALREVHGLGPAEPQS